MGKSNRRKFREGFAFIEILLTLAAILLIYFAAAKLYPKEPGLKKDMAEQGIDTTSRKTIIDSSRKIMQKVQDQHEDIDK